MSDYQVRSVDIDDVATARMIVSQSNGIGAAIPSQIKSELESGSRATTGTLDEFWFSKKVNLKGLG
ncbi:MAG: hypothetical protein AB8B57_10305 [Congregibacter sp.]